MELAARVLEQVAPGMRPSDSVRASGQRPRVVTLDRAGGFASGDRLADLVCGVVGEEHDSARGTAAVIVPPSLEGAVEDALRRAGLMFGTAGREALDEQLSVLTIED